MGSITRTGKSKPCVSTVRQIWPDPWACFAVTATTGILAQTIATPLGRKLLHTWHLRPLLDIRQIEERHDAVELFSNPNHQDDSDLMRRAMKSVGNATKHCTQILRGRGKPSDWRALVDVSELVHFEFG